ncbi:MAG: hypothetical protein EOO39_24310 [Cytophagaceae bacterium]|nr:MAG: hypothetical protein EOO39_24310 [Cytophagaceae bacterium]
MSKTATISIEGTRIEGLRHLIIEQSLHTYHTFELAIEHERLNDHFSINPKFGPFLGKNISIIIAGEGNMPKLTFEGIIAEEGLFQRDDEYRGEIVFRGHGQPYQLDSLPGISMYVDKSPTDIANACLAGYKKTKKVISVVGPTAAIPYCVRYQETYWNFLRRLAYDYGAWFYYDGQVLNFTQTPGTAPPVKLTFGADLTWLRTGSRAVALHHKQIDYFSETHTNQTAEGTANPLLFATMDELYQTGHRKSSLAADVAPLALNWSESQKALTQFTRGRTVIPGISPGTSIQIGATLSGDQIGELHVLTVRHVTDQMGDYYNEFEATSGDFKRMPPEVLHRPQVGPQLGEVTDNKDPKNLGRVKVRLEWMDSGTTPWIRTVMPSFGKGERPVKNRGFQFVPDVGDQVLVAYEQNDPDRPVVMGALPHYVNAGVDTPAVKEHHISVMSGSILRFVDTATVHEFHMEVNPQNTIFIKVDSSMGTITVKSNDKIRIEATNQIDIEAMTINIKGQNVNINGSIKVDVKGGEIAEKATGPASFEGATVDIKATSTLNATGAMTKVAGTGMATLESSGITTVKGSMVMVN